MTSYLARFSSPIKGGFLIGTKDYHDIRADIRYAKRFPTKVHALIACRHYLRKLLNERGVEEMPIISSTIEDGQVIFCGEIEVYVYDYERFRLIEIVNEMER